MNKIELTKEVKKLVDDMSEEEILALNWAIGDIPFDFKRLDDKLEIFRTALNEKMKSWSSGKIMFVADSLNSERIAHASSMLEQSQRWADEEKCKKK